MSIPFLRQFNAYATPALDNADWYWNLRLFRQTLKV